MSVETQARSEREILPSTTAAILHTVSASAVPRHANEETAIVSKIRRPVVLRISLQGGVCQPTAPTPSICGIPYHQVVEVLLQRIVVQALERLGVVKLAAEGVAGSVVLAEDVEPQLVGPPVTVLDVVSVSCTVCFSGMLLSYLGTATASVGDADRALAGFLSETAHDDEMIWCRRVFL